MSSGGESDQSGNVRMLKLIRIVRLARLLKLARIFKISRLLAILENFVDVSPIVIKIMKLVLQLLFVSHLIGCTWFFFSVVVDRQLSACDAGQLSCMPGEQ